MKKKLEGGQFRYLNEQLYTKESKESFEIFSSDPSLFEAVSGNPIVEQIDWDEHSWNFLFPLHM